MKAKHSAALIFVVALLGHAPSCWSGSYSWAWDDADAWDSDINDYTYDRLNHTWDPNLNGGFGFTPWVDLGASGSGQHFLVEFPGEGSVDHWWGLSGVEAMGRGLQNPLAVGSWTLSAAHNLHALTDLIFSGFNLKASTDDPFNDNELLRFGFNPTVEYEASTSDGIQGICVSVDGGVNYGFLDCGWEDGNGDELRYSVRWDGLAGDYTLTVRNVDEGKTSVFSGHMPTGSVAMLGTAIYGAYQDETITFDAYDVVPEPAAALPAFAALSLIAALCRRSRACFP